ncbi:MAG: glycine dehydrogenase (aminomethyl-transferring), partial [Methyloligellaceae bacterium]
MSGFEAIMSKGRAEFLNRHVGPGEEEQKTMLEFIGAGSLDELMLKIVPESIQDDSDLDLSPPMTEAELLTHLKQLGQQNKEMISLIGQGYYGCYTPSVIKRNILENPGWYTSYTPYQPEISQGRLEALINFQTLVIDLTGLPVTNASLLDEATAAAESVSIMRRQSKSKSNKLFVSDNCFSQTLDVIRTRTEPLDIEVVVGGANTNFSELDVFGAVLQYSGSNGEIVDWRSAVLQLQGTGALVAIAADPLMLTLAMSPGEMGADIAFGSMQRFGIPMFLGGPHAAFLASDERHKRAMPGRIVGVSHDRNGHVSYRLALQTREQHIRREKATSNICTAQALLAILSGFYAVYHGADGLKNIATRVHRIAGLICSGMKSAGFTIENVTFFDTLTINVPGQAANYHRKARDAGINLREIDGDNIGLSVDETTDSETLGIIWGLFDLDPKELASNDGSEQFLPEELLRTDEILEHPVFKNYRSETELMRYARRLMDKDIALDRSMIPLGSCTMKLNAATEMIPVSFSEFANIHPFAPESQTLGYQKLIGELENMLCIVTGYDAVSLQPNSGAQGEYAGLLAIRNYHLSRGDGERTVCLIPSSAHGTNPASAQMVGMDVVVVKCDDNGDIDIDDLT